MSKVLSFSVPDSWLDVLASLYPDETPNLAAKKALGEIVSGSIPKLSSNIVSDDYISKIESNSLSLDAIESKVEHLESKLIRLDTLEQDVKFVLEIQGELEALMGK